MAKVAGVQIGKDEGDGLSGEFAGDGQRSVEDEEGAGHKRETERGSDRDGLKSAGVYHAHSLSAESQSRTKPTPLRPSSLIHRPNISTETLTSNISSRSNTPAPIIHLTLPLI